MILKQKLTPAEKMQLVQQYLNGELSACAAKQIAGVTNMTLHRWIA